MKYLIALKDCKNEALRPGETVIVKEIIIEAEEVDVEEDAQGNPTFYNFLKKHFSDDSSPTVAVFPYAAVAYVVMDRS